MKSQDTKGFLAGLCLAALLAGGTLAAPAPALGSSGCASGGKTTQEGSGSADGGDDGPEGGEGAEEESAEGNGS
ncbi:SbtA family thio(seleno)oxazole RiPP natural product precursor [Desulfurivibrio sp. D14AmB]|uniref:SbtA family thio(seleno)oxazole RiPP natural product precursor n=1 Tax=Desulfurivibrio sp. D14AmB TaxID=3374370 RepID=UPI00376EEF37